MQGLRRSENVGAWKDKLDHGNRKVSPVTKIGVYTLLLSSGFTLDLNKCCYSPEMARNVISFHALYKQDNLGNNVLCIDSTNDNNLDKASLWHCRLGHVSKKRIGQLQKDGVLESFDLKSDDSCESCLLGKMTKSPFTGSCARGEGTLRCFDPIAVVSILVQSSSTILGMWGCLTIDTSQDTTVEWCSAERRNRTLLDMVRSMMSRASLPISFGWCLRDCRPYPYLVPTKKVAKTPHEMWTGKVPSLAHIKIGVAKLSKEGVFSRERFISQGNSGRQIDLEEIQESSGEGTSNPSSQLEEETPVDPIDKSVPLRRSTRVRNAPEHYYGFHITAEGRKTLGANGSSRRRPTWMVIYTLIRRDWLQRAFSQTPGVDYDETFSPVAKIKSIRVLLAIAAFHDYEIWQMDVKTAFLNGKLAEDVYMNQPEGLVSTEYP
ncbi:unnamed protein product [Lactuca virosa]|uniref:Uncharacterized protein n=1 Tax=Lactuca virosa TaxID=75947 RepID=A0AAU9NLM2_9ASTR|nr:unnamed protein product [Lactuca virosa]